MKRRAEVNRGHRGTCVRGRLDESSIGVLGHILRLNGQCIRGVVWQDVP